MAKLIRFTHTDSGDVPHLGLLLGRTLYDITNKFSSISAWLRASAGRVTEAITELESISESTSNYHEGVVFLSSGSDIWSHEQLKRPYDPYLDWERWSLPNGLAVLPPVDTQEIWAAGVTYERSREARQQEAVDGGDVYARVYQAERPELFFKAQGWRVVGHGAEVGIRADATWSVPEAELGVVFNPAMEVVGFTVGNDMSSRDIEGANPLYLPQAKLYRASCALGMGIRLNPSSEWPDTTIRMTIKRSSETVFYGDVHTSRIRRKITELADYLGRSMDFPDGVVLLTGTGIVPPAEFTLDAGDIVEIEIEGIDMLVNTVKVV
jgi:2-dehydro-3-deoxy-D-arabinonate dehydratase